MLLCDEMSLLTSKNVLVPPPVLLWCIFSLLGNLELYIPSPFLPCTSLSLFHHFPGSMTAKGMACGPAARSGASDHCYHLFASSPAPAYGAVPSSFGAVSPSGKTPPLQKPSDALGMFDSAARTLQGAQGTRETGTAQPMSVRGTKQMGLVGDAPCGGVGMMQFGSPVGNPLGMGDPLTRVFGGNQPTGIDHVTGSSPQTRDGGLLGSGLDETTNKNYNPFLDI